MHQVVWVCKAPVRRLCTPGGGCHFP